MSGYGPEDLPVGSVSPAPDPAAATFRSDVLSGLLSRPKTLPPKYFYDERGLTLFNAIRETPEYYLTRTELSIMTGAAGEIAAEIGAGAVLVEYGSGSSDKAALLLEQMQDPVGVVLIDISPEHLLASVQELRLAYPDLWIDGVAADFTRPVVLPAPPRRTERTVLYFAGSTIGNFDHEHALSLLRAMRATVEPGDALLIGIDRIKRLEVLLPAYDDARGVTAAFNRNLLHRVNRELGADFDPSLFRHEARWNPEYDRIEMHLVSERAQTVQVDGHAIDFAGGESIHTESSHKYDLERFVADAEGCGFRFRKAWSDSGDAFSVILFEATPP